eukprot:6260905-Amphidinium_carterae.1
MTRAIEARERLDDLIDEEHNQIENNIQDESTSTTIGKQPQEPQAANLQEGTQQPKAPPPGVR